MSRRFYFKSEPFEFSPGITLEQEQFEFEPEDFGFEWDGEEWEEEIKRGSQEHSAWVQHSLNQVKGLRLAVDGLIGAATRSAIRSFQQQNGLGVDGVVGPQTEQKIVQALKQLLTAGQHTVCAVIRRPEALDRFDFDSDKVKPHHQPQISQIAQCVVASQGALQPIHSIRLVGHTDPVGSDAYNLDLGRRRANQVKRSLADNIDLLSPGLSGKIAFTVETRGELQPITGDAARSRRVEVFVPVKVIPPPQKGCPPFKARLRVHFKILPGYTPKNASIATMFDNMKKLYGAAGFLVELASTENLAVTPNLDGNDAIDVGDCREGTVTAEQQQLFSNRNNVKDNEIVVYFVRATSPDALNGCAAHPAGRPGAVVAEIASQWTLAHEVGHVLSLNHVTGEPCANPAFTPTRLMTGCGTGRLKGTPTLVKDEIKKMDQSVLTVNC